MNCFSLELLALLADKNGPAGLKLALLWSPCLLLACSCARFGGCRLWCARLVLQNPCGWRFPLPFSRRVSGKLRATSFGTARNLGTIGYHHSFGCPKVFDRSGPPGPPRPPAAPAPECPTEFESNSYTK